MIYFSIKRTLLIYKYLIEVSGGIEGLKRPRGLRIGSQYPVQNVWKERHASRKKERKTFAWCSGLI